MDSGGASGLQGGSGALVANLPSTPCNLAGATFADTGPDVIP